MAEDFDFIMNKQEQKTNLLTNGYKNQKIIIVAVGAIILILLAFIFYTLLFGSQKNTKEIILPVAGVQADIQSLTAMGLKELRGPDLQNSSATTGLVIASHIGATNQYLGKTSDKQLEENQNTGFKKELESALQTGSFDQEYAIILAEKLDLYKQRIVTAYNELDNIKIKKELERMHSEAKILSGEPSAPQNQD